MNARVTWAVVECGFGGRVDSTNVIDGEMCVLTNVGLEHTAVLGTTHAAIAFQKVGILKHGATMITGVVPHCAAGKVIAEEAGKLGCPVIFCANLRTTKRLRKSTRGWQKWCWTRSGGWLHHLGREVLKTTHRRLAYR